MTRCSIPYLAVALATALLACPCPGKSVNARIVYFHPAADDPKELFVPTGTEGEYQQISPLRGVDADPVTCAVDAAGNLVFTGSRAAAPVVASAAIPNGVTQAVIFLLRKPAAGGAAYQALVVDESHRSLPKGGSFVCNLSPNEVRVVVGELKYQLAPGKTASLKRPGTVNEHNMAAFQMAMQQAGEWTRMKDGMMRFSESERYFMLVYLENGTRPSVKIFKQAASPVPVPEQARAGANPSMPANPSP